MPREFSPRLIPKSMAVFIRNQDGLDVSRLWIHHSWRAETQLADQKPNVDDTQPFP
jgi:hypothetical protein